MSVRNLSVIRITGLTVLLYSISSVSLAQTYSDGQHYYEAEEYCEAFRIFQPLAEDGHANAQHRLGAMYIQGFCVGRDLCSGLSWLRRAAEQGHVKAQLGLGTILYGQSQSSNECPSRQRTAAEWIARAANQGQPEAQNLLSWLYLNGDGVSQDELEAYKWALLAKENGSESDHGYVDRLANALSQEEREEVERRAREWQPSDFQDTHFLKK